LRSPLPGIYIIIYGNKKIPTPLPIGKSPSDRVIEDDSYHTDKALFIKDLLDKDAAVTLCACPRLRRFGKDARGLFNRLKIKIFRTHE
jgi:hypothetical protein